MASDGQSVDEWRINRLEEAVKDINEHGSRAAAGLAAKLDELKGDIAEMRGETRDIPVLREVVRQNTDTFKAMRTAMYGLAGAILSAAVLVVLIGHG